MASDRYNHFSDDVIIEILLNLPVKSLLKFKSVCKNWYALITNPNFISDHLHHRHNHDRLLVNHYINNTRNHAFDLFPDETLGSSSISTSYQDPYMQSVAHAREIIGPFNGLFCVLNDSDRLALWNPATRELRPLPVSHPVWLQPGSNSFGHMIGFGLDPLNNDYKVVWIIWDCGDVETDEPVMVSVYNLGTDSWKKLEDVDWISNLDVDWGLCNTTYLNGVYYWRADGYDDDDDDTDNDDDNGDENIATRAIILSFDFGDDIFREIQTPDICISQRWSIALYNERIAMLLYSPSEAEKYIDIWVMEGVGCWTHQLTIGPLSNIRRPVGCWNNGEVLLETGDRKLILCDPSSNQEIRDLGPRGNGYLIQVLSYKESLVSVKGGIDYCEDDTSSAILQIHEFIKSDIAPLQCRIYNEVLQCFQFICQWVQFMHLCWSRNGNV